MVNPPLGVSSELRWSAELSVVGAAAAQVSMFAGSSRWGGLTRRSVVSVTDRQTDRQLRSNAATTAYCTDTAYNTQYCTHSTQ